MKSYFALLSFICLYTFSISTNPQDWINQQNFRLNSIYFFDDSYGWAVGNDGVVLRTTTGGDYWIKVNAGTGQQLDDVFFVSQSVGWICGDDIRIRKTTDGGLTWFEVSSLGYLPYHTIHFIDASTGWIGGYSKIYKTTDGGSTWAMQFNGDRTRSIFFLNANTGWAAHENGNIRRTTDGGTNWVLATTNPGGIYLAIDFLDSNNGWVVGTDDCVRKTTDGGDTWISVSTTGFSGYSYYGLKFTSSTTGWIVGTNGMILKTTDAGSTWSQQTTGTTDQLMAITIAGTSGWVCGFNGRILKNSSTNPVPVELSSFTTKCVNNYVQLNWRTETEVDNYGFEIERAVINPKSRIRNPQFEKIGFVEGHGNSNSPKNYSFTDEKPFGGSRFQYRLKQIDTDGEFEYSDIVEVEIIPEKFELFQNYPNPFNPVTTIRFQLPVDSKVVLKLYDILGSEVMTILDEKKDAGIYEVILNVSDLPSGTYIYRMITDKNIETKKILVLK